MGTASTLKSALSSNRATSCGGISPTTCASPVSSAGERVAGSVKKRNSISSTWAVSRAYTGGPQA